MIIKVTDINCGVHLVALANIARVSPAGPNSQGIRAYVKLCDGGTLESRDSIDDIHSAMHPTPPGKPQLVSAIMEQAQVFASTWSLVDGQFDKGDMLQQAEAAKAELRQLVTAAVGSE